MNTAAYRYAEALHEQGCPYEELEETYGYLTGCKPLWEALESPAVEIREKKAVLKRLPNFTDNETLKSFYEMLAQRQRFSLLKDIVREYKRIEMKEKNEGTCVIKCARDPGDEALGRLAKFLCAKHGYKAITFEIVKEPGILGGFTLEIDGITYDKSVGGHLKSMARMLQEG